jgi:hypothetical protein
MSANYAQLPTYTDYDAKQPLLESGARLNEDNEVLVVGDERTCGRNGHGFFGRMRARCAARRAAKYGPPCENEGCVKQARRRRRFRLFFFGLISLFVITHLLKGAYMFYRLPKHVNCQEITSTETTFDFALPRSMMVDYSLTGTGTTSITHSSEISSDQVSVRVEFESLEEDEKVYLCAAQFKKRFLAVGAYAKDHKGDIPKVKKTTIVLPEDAKAPSIRFGTKKAGKCAEKMVRKRITLE